MTARRRPSVGEHPRLTQVHLVHQDHRLCARLGQAYATFDGHRNDDFATYVYVTEDFGKTWTRLAKDFAPNNSAYVIKEGLSNPALLILGTEVGMYVSLYPGQTCRAKYGKDAGFPTVRVDDVLVIHPAREPILVGTHGRALWTVPFVALEFLTPFSSRRMSS